MKNNAFGAIPFFPGTPDTKPELLSHYLPPIPRGVVSTWLEMNIPPGSWILDPFGASPRIAVEAARLGYRVMVAANNPIARFLIEFEADQPNQGELKAALAELAASYVGNERLEPHIRSLYSTYCAHCGQIVSADTFLWEHDKPSPYARIYTCPSCGDSGEHPCTTNDAAQASKFSSSGLHRARALERVVAYNDQDRIHVEQALSVYNPRALYGLITIINKMQGLNLTDNERKRLSSLLLYAFDQTNSMWRPQAQSDRRRQLALPRHSRETNIWCALEEGIARLSVNNIDGMQPTTTVTTWPQLPAQDGGICIYEGRLVNLIESIRDIEIKSMCAAIPRPNQAYWTLSALWSGWLWGREAVGKFKSVLHRQRYDWAWHTTALASVFKQLANFLPAATPMFGLIGEVEPGFIGSALVAAAGSGCRLENIAVRLDEQQAQILWKSERERGIWQTGSFLTEKAIQSAKMFLETIAEPASYLNTISAAFWGIINHWQSELDEQTNVQVPGFTSSTGTKQPTSLDEPTPSLIYSNTYNTCREALSYRSGFLRFNLQDETIIEAATKSQTIQSTLFTLEGDHPVEAEDEIPSFETSPAESEINVEKERHTRSSDVTGSTFLWLRETGQANHLTATDKYENFLVEFLINHPRSTLIEIDRAVCNEFRGLFTPGKDFIDLCLQSYAIPEPDHPDRWIIRSEDDPAARKLDIAEINRYIHQIGTRLGFACTGQTTSSLIPFIDWQDEPGKPGYWFFTCHSAAISEIVLHGEQPPLRGFIVYPASRANLLVYKLRRDPRLNKSFDSNQGVWRFLKFRHLRTLAESPLVNRENMDQMLALDPLTFSTPQLWLI